MTYNSTRPNIRPAASKEHARGHKINLLVTMYNMSQHEIWCKPESGSNSPYKISPFRANMLGLDGFTHPAFPDMVYKVVDKYSIRLRLSLIKIIILPNGIFWGLNDLENQALGGGWKTQDWFHKQNDFNWDELFLKA